MTEDQVVIVTHDGIFHADDATGVMILYGLYPNALIVRTRDPGQINAATFVVDEGNEYNPKKGRFDHHHIKDHLCRRNGIPFAAAGMVWDYHGKDYLRNLNIHEDNVDLVHQDVDRTLIQFIDGIDNRHLTVERSRPPRGIPIPTITLSATIAMMNPIRSDKNNKDEQMKGFRLAMKVVSRVLATCIDQAVERCNEPRPLSSQRRTNRSSRWIRPSH